MLLELLKGTELAIGLLLTALGIFGLCSLFNNFSGTSWRIKVILLGAGVVGVILIRLSQ